MVNAASYNITKRRDDLLLMPLQFDRRIVDVVDQAFIRNHGDLFSPLSDHFVQ